MLANHFNPPKYLSERVEAPEANTTIKRGRDEDSRCGRMQDETGDWSAMSMEHMDEKTCLTPGFD